MNASEFLELVEKHKLPWSYEHGFGYTDASGAHVSAPVLVHDAPALAAAAIRLLRARAAVDEAVVNPQRPDQLTDAQYDFADSIEGVRAALPPDLRP